MKCGFIDDSITDRVNCIVIVKLTICVFAEVFKCVDYFLSTNGRGAKVCFFVLWQTGQGRVGVGMSAMVCDQSNIEMLLQNRGERIFLMSVAGEGQCR